MCGAVCGIKETRQQRGKDSKMKKLMDGLTVLVSGPHTVDLAIEVTESSTLNLLPGSPSSRSVHI